MSGIFKLCPTHFSRGGGKFSKGASPPPGYGPEFEPGLWSRNSNFCLLLQASKIIRSDSRALVHWKTKNHCIICTC